MIFHEFDKIGKDLFSQALNNSHSGNISIRQGSRIIVTASGSMLHRLEISDLVTAPIFSDHDDLKPFFSGLAKKPSLETDVHRAVYKMTDALAIVHAHPPFTVTVADSADFIVPLDAEGSYYFKKIPVISAEKTIGSDEIAQRLPRILLKNRVPLAAVKGHGVFSCGLNLKDAYKWISSLENSCKLIVLKRAFKNHSY
jgi:L-fuculose-phosphate aldolase